MRVTESWRLKDERYTLQGQADSATGEITFPPREVAPREVSAYTFGTNAEDESYILATEDMLTLAQDQ